MKETLAFHIAGLYRDFLGYTTGELKALGVSFGQMPVIIYVGRHPGCSQADLTKMLRLDWGYSQRSVTKLVYAGMLRKAYDEKSACNCLNLTERGKEAFDVSHRVFTDWDTAKLGAFSPEEKETLLNLLSKITG